MAPLPYDPPFGAPCWFELSSPDPDAAEGFYSELLGWRFEGAGPLGLGSAAHADGRRVAGVSAQPPGQQGPAFWSVYFRVEELSAYLAQVDEAGGQALMAIPDFDGSAGVALTSDPAGTAFGVLAYDDDRAMQSFGTAGAVHWTELFTADPTVRDFYASAFGWGFTSLTGADVASGDPDAGAAQQGYWAIEQAGNRIGGVFDASAVSIPAHWEAHIHVPNVDALEDRVRELGGDVLAAPHDSHHGRVGRFIDAQNAAFTLVTPA
ncbi:MAG: VOC family protein [Brevibacterium yomogidense]